MNTCEVMVTSQERACVLTGVSSLEPHALIAAARSGPNGMFRVRPILNDDQGALMILRDEDFDAAGRRVGGEPSDQLVARRMACDAICRATR